METSVEVLEVRRLMSLAAPVGISNDAPAEAAQALRVAGEMQGKSRPFAVLSRRTLTVRGTSGDDVISFIWVSEVLGGEFVSFIEVHLNGQPLRFPVSDVLRVVVRAGRGNDDIDAYGNGWVTAPNRVFRFMITTYGGPGDDRIRGSVRGDRIVGGAGNDTILARENVVDFIFGGPGTDVAERDRAPGGPSLLVGDRVWGVETMTP